MSMKNPMTLPGIEPATFRFVAQHLNHCATAVPIPLWGTASNSNSEVLQRYQNKVLRATENAPWYICNEVIHADLKVPTIRELQHSASSTEIK